MDKPTDPAASAPGDSKSSTPAPKKRRRWLTILIAFVAVLFLLVALLPTLAGTGPGRALARSIVNGNLNGSVEFDDLSVGWTSGVTIDGLRVKDDKGQLVLKAGKVRTQLSLWRTLRKGFGDFDLGQTDVDGLDLANVHVDERGQLNLARLAKESKKEKPTEPVKLAGEIRIKGMVGKVSADQVAQVLRILPSDVTVKITGLDQPIAHDVKLALAVEQGGTSASGATAGAGAQGKPGTITLRGDFDPKTVRFSEDLALAGVDLAALNPLLAIGRTGPAPVRLTGVADGALKLTAQGPDNTGAEGLITVADAAASGPAFAGDTARSKSVRIPIKIARGAGGQLDVPWVRVETDYGTVGIVASVPEESLRRLAKGEAPGGAGTITINVDFPKAADLVNSMPNLFRLEKGVTVTSANLTAHSDVALTKDRVDVKNRVGLTVTGTRREIDPATKQETTRQIALAPIEQTVNATFVPAGDEIRDVAYAFKSDFANVTGTTGKGGSLASLQLEGGGDLTKLRAQLAQFFAMGDAPLAGTFTVKAGTRGDPSAPDAAVDLNAEVTVKDAAIGSIRRPWLQLALTGKLNMKGHSPQSLTGAEVTLKGTSAAQPTAHLVAKGDVGLKPFSANMDIVADVRQLREMMSGPPAVAATPAVGAPANPVSDLISAVLSGNVKVAREGASTMRVDGTLGLKLVVRTAKDPFTDTITFAFGAAVPDDSSQPLSGKIDIGSATGAIRFVLADAKIADWGNQRRIIDKVQADVEVDWPKAWALVRPLLDAETLEDLKDLQIVGTMRRRFELSGSFPATGPDKAGNIVALPLQNSLRFLTAKGGVTIPRLQAMGLDLQNIDLPIFMNDGVVHLAGHTGGKQLHPPGPIACNGGEINLGGDIRCDLNRLDPKEPGKIVPMLTIGKQNWSLFKGVRVTPAFARTAMGKYLNTAFADAEKANGVLNVTVVYCENVPLGSMLTSPDNPGRAKLEMAMSAVEIKSGGLDWIATAMTFLASRVGGGSGTGEAAGALQSVEGEIEKSSVTIERGRIVHDLNLKTNRFGEWQFDGDLTLATRDYKYLKVRVPSTLLPVPEQVRRFMGPTVTLTMSGPINKPQLSPKFVEEFVADTVKGGLIPGVLDSLTGGGKKPKDAPRGAPADPLRDIAGQLLNPGGKDAPPPPPDRRDAVPADRRPPAAPGGAADPKQTPPDAAPSGRSPKRRAMEEQERQRELEKQKAEERK
ncbi:MAG TPA: hypothetical protein VEA69_18795 [Tepidisphaeraceae bacterium]|nr:hypothetical protein [Tepidisphaeraceae bacterium]